MCLPEFWKKIKTFWKIALNLGMKHEAYFESPYRILNIEERMFTTKSDETLTVDPDSGQYYTMRKVAKDKKVLHDGLVYTKLFQESILQLTRLSGSGIKVLLYAMATVHPLSETVVLNIPDVALFCDLGNSSCYAGINELLDKRLICRKLGSSIEFWFDPNVFFNGNRLRILK